MPNLSTQRPIRASLTAPPISHTRVSDVRDSVMIDLSGDDYMSVVTLYLTPEQARDLANQLDTAADRIDADRDPTLAEIGGAA
jgi:hypothetical protein